MALQASCKHCGAGVALSTASRTGGYCDGCQPALTGMAGTVEEQERAAAEYGSRELTAKLCEPGKDISQTAGEMERRSPLFFGTGDNPTLF